jgi:hypothetical protein
MLSKSDWDWELGSREIVDIRQWQNRFNWVEEPYASPNGDKILLKTIQDGNYTRRVIYVAKILR